MHALWHGEWLSGGDRQWQHSEMWWPRLFQHHAAIQWDDYDKDYSDLPPQVLYLTPLVFPFSTVWFWKVQPPDLLGCPQQSASQCVVSNKSWMQLCIGDVLPACLISK